MNHGPKKPAPKSPEHERKSPAKPEAPGVTSAPSAQSMEPPRASGAASVKPYGLTEMLLGNPGVGKTETFPASPSTEAPTHAEMVQVIQGLLASKEKHYDKSATFLLDKVPEVLAARSLLARAEQAGVRQPHLTGHRQRPSEPGIYLVGRTETDPGPFLESVELKNGVLRGSTGMPVEDYADNFVWYGPIRLGQPGQDEAAPMGSPIHVGSQATAGLRTAIGTIERLISRIHGVHATTLADTGDAYRATFPEMDKLNEVRAALRAAEAEQTAATPAAVAPAVARVEKFLVEWSRGPARSPVSIYGLNTGDENREAELFIADLQSLLDGVRQPKTEPSAAIAHALLDASKQMVEWRALIRQNYPDMGGLLRGMDAAIAAIAEAEARGITFSSTALEGALMDIAKVPLKEDPKDPVTGRPKDWVRLDGHDAAGMVRIARRALNLPCPDPK